jgi:replicative DNA helicase
MHIDKLKNSQTEMAVLSILMNFNDAFDNISDRLKPVHFSEQQYRTIFVEIQKQISSGKGCDVISLSERLKATATLAELNDISQFQEVGARSLSRYVQILIDSFKARQLHGMATTMTELAFLDGPIQDRLDKAQSEVSKLQENEDTDEWVDAYTAAMEHTQLLEKRHSGEDVGLETGLVGLDEVLHGGMHRGNLVVLGARPAMGKTALAMTLGLHMAEKYSVGFLSMEMPHNDVRDRQAAILSKTSISSIKRPAMGLEYDKIVDGLEKSRHLKFFVSDKSGLNILNVRSKARSLKRKHGLDVLIVDYIGLMSGVNPSQLRAYQIEEISRGLKGLAKELDIVVICLAQVNRQAAQSSAQIPGLQDLRDSGAIEQDADVVGFIHRPIAADPALGPLFQNYALLRVAKNRQGKTGDIHMTYYGEYTYFDAWHGEPPVMNKVSAKKDYL